VEKLNALNDLVQERFPQVHSRAYADTGPVAERVFAKHAGLGWLGKNTLLLNEALGSWFFLGVILSSLTGAHSGGCRSATGGFVRQLQAMSGCVPNRSVGRAVCYGRTALHLPSAHYCGSIQ
jgi:hypothetical protein